MKFYYKDTLGNRYVSEQAGLENCKNMKFKLMRVDQYGVETGVRDIVEGLIGGDQTCESCLKKNNNKPICLWGDHTCQSGFTKSVCSPGGTWCTPPTPAPPTPPPTPLPACSSMDSSTNCCARALGCISDCGKSSITYNEQLFSPAGPSGEPIPTPTPPVPPVPHGTVSQYCNWVNESCQDLDIKQCTIPKLPDKVFIGYWGAAADQQDCLKLEQLPEAIDKGYNIITIAFAKLESTGNFEITTNCSTFSMTKTQINNKTKKQDMNSWIYTLSVGGGDAGWPEMSGTPESFSATFVKKFLSIANQYGFQGYDIDIEHELLRSHDGKGLKTLSLINKNLYSLGFFVTMAPQPANIFPSCGGLAGGVDLFSDPWNLYVPLIDSEGIKNVSLVAIQVYNNQHAAINKPGFLSQYVKSLQQDNCVLSAKFPFGTGKINIPSEKLLFGFPATTGAATYTIPGVAEDPKTLVTLYNNADSANLKNTKGLMTWSIGWDANNNWQWINAVKDIWK
jgi:chitinase